MGRAEELATIVTSFSDLITEFPCFLDRRSARLQMPFPETRLPWNFPIHH